MKGISRREGATAHPRGLQSDSEGYLRSHVMVSNGSFVSDIESVRLRMLYKGLIYIIFASKPDISYENEEQEFMHTLTPYLWSNKMLLVCSSNIQ